MKHQSKYKPIWGALKAGGTCKITAPVNYHKTIIKMVRRTRDRDTAYLFHLAETNKEHQINTVIHNTVITFTLTERINIHGL